MNPEQGSGHTPDRQTGITGEINPVARSVMSKVKWSRQLLSPWVQRSLQTPRKVLGQPMGKSVGLTVANTSALLNRLQRAADESLIWQPNLGSLNPGQVDRFTSNIVNRLAETGPKYQATQTSEPRPVATTDLILAGGGGAATTGAEAAESEPNLPFAVEDVRRALANRSWSSEPGSAVATPVSPSPSPAVQRQAAKPRQENPLSFTLAEVRAALEQPHFKRASSGPGQTSTSSPIQRTTTSRSIQDQSLARRRPRSRVEEVSPDEAGKPPSLPPLPAPSEQTVEPKTTASTTNPAQRQSDEAGTETITPLQRKIAPETPVRTSPRPTTRAGAEEQPLAQRRSEATAPPAKIEQSAPKAVEPGKIQTEQQPSPAEVESDRGSEAVVQRQPEMPPSLEPQRAQPELESEAVVQRQPEMPLRQASPSAQVGEEAATEEVGSKQASAEPQRAQPKSEAVIQRQPEMPLREASPSAQVGEEAAAEEVAPKQTSAEPQRAQPGSESEPVVQRQPEMPLRQAPPSTRMEGEAATEMVGAKQASVEPQQVQPKSEPGVETNPPPTEADSSLSEQRRPEPEMPLRQPRPVPEPQAPTPVAQRQADAAELPLPERPALPGVVEQTAGEDVEPAKSRLEQQSSAELIEASGQKREPVIQRQPEMPLREAPRPVRGVEEAAAKVVAPQQASVEPQPIQPKSETAAETGPPPAKADSPPSEQRRPEPEMPLRQPRSVPEPLPVERAESQAQEAEPDLSSQMPVAQRQPEMPLRQPPVRAGVEAQPVSAESPEQKPKERQAETEVDLNRNILDKVEAGFRLPLTKPLSPRQTNVTQRQPLPQPGILPQARRGDDPAERPSSPVDSERPSLPLAKIPMPQVQEQKSVSPAMRAASSSASVQRQPIAQAAVVQPVEPPVAVRSGEVIQREPDGPDAPVSDPLASTAAPQQPGLDLDQLARQVYPEIKRLLAWERDRLGR